MAKNDKISKALMTYLMQIGPVGDSYVGKDGKVTAKTAKEIDNLVKRTLGKSGAKKSGLAKGGLPKKKTVKKK